MQMIQDGPYAHTPEKPLRMTGRADFCEVCVCVYRRSGVCACGKGRGREEVWEGEGEEEVWERGGGRKCVFCTESVLHREYDSFILICIISFISQKAKLLVAELMDQKEMEVSGLDSSSFTPTNVILLTSYRLGA